MMPFQYIPYIFDNKLAWEKTIMDERFSPMMTFYEFMKIYQEHRNGKPLATKVQKRSPLEPSSLLSQAQIDELIDRKNKKAES